MTDQIEFSSPPQGLTTTVLHPMDADQPESLPASNKSGLIRGSNRW
jgi:hypothetical protein